MKLIAVLVLALLGLVAAQSCETGYYSVDDSPCHYACSDGCGDQGCNADGGACVSSTCEDNWQNSEKDNNKCDAPMCFGKVKGGCAEGGQCVGPNTCICGQSGAQIVAKAGEYDGVEGTNCVSLRKDGIMGAGVALVVMTISISICGGIERALNKNK